VTPRRLSRPLDEAGRAIEQLRVQVPSFARQAVTHAIVELDDLRRESF